MYIYLYICSSRLEVRFNAYKCNDALSRNVHYSFCTLYQPFHFYYIPMNSAIIILFNDTLHTLRHFRFKIYTRYARCKNTIINMGRERIPFVRVRKVHWILNSIYLFSHGPSRYTKVFANRHLCLRFNRV